MGIVSWNTHRLFPLIYVPIHLTIMSKTFLLWATASVINTPLIKMFNLTWFKWTNRTNLSQGYLYQTGSPHYRFLQTRRMRQPGASLHKQTPFWRAGFVRAQLELIWGSSAVVRDTCIRWPWMYPWIRPCDEAGDSPQSGVTSLMTWYRGDKMMYIKWDSKLFILIFEIC
jgi:hypothetical protein